MTTATAYPNAPELSTDSYILIGLATCFVREDGEIKEVKVAEPIPSAALEAILKGITTSYQQATATTLGTVVSEAGQMQMVPSFPAAAQFCEDFVTRTISAARTYQAQPEVQNHIPLGTTYQEFNFSTERKRVLNAENIVSTEDNVKQHAYTHEVL